MATVELSHLAECHVKPLVATRGGGRHIYLT